MTDNSQYSGTRQAGGILEAVRSFRAVGAQRRRRSSRALIVAALFFYLKTAQNA